MALFFMYVCLRAGAQWLNLVFTRSIRMKTRIQSSEGGTLVDGHAAPVDRQRGLVHVYVKSAEPVLSFEIRWPGAQ